MSENIFNTAKKGFILVYEISDTFEEAENNIDENNEKENDNNGI